jgi:dihydroorotate dehydrogenase
LVPSGGITHGFDIVQCLEAGANAVEVCTAVYRDPDVVQKMVRELEWFMSKGGYTKVREIVGKAIENIPFDYMDIPIHL